VPVILAELVQYLRAQLTVAVDAFVIVGGRNDTFAAHPLRVRGNNTGLCVFDLLRSQRCKLPHWALFWASFQL
jgi:hypothetical protein